MDGISVFRMIKIFSLKITKKYTKINVPKVQEYKYMFLTINSLLLKNYIRYEVQGNNSCVTGENVQQGQLGKKSTLTASSGLIHLASYSP